MHQMPVVSVLVDLPAAQHPVERPPAGDWVPAIASPLEPPGPVRFSDLLTRVSDRPVMVGVEREGEQLTAAVSGDAPPRGPSIDRVGEHRPKRGLPPPHIPEQDDGAVLAVPQVPA